MAPARSTGVLPPTASRPWTGPTPVACAGSRWTSYPQARAAGFGAPIVTPYRSVYPWGPLRRFVDRTPLLAVTVTRDQVRDGCAAFCGKVPLLTHTVNDSADAAALARMGVAGVYTDDLLP